VRADAEPLPKVPNRLLLIRDGGLTLIDPDGKNELQLKDKKPAETVKTISVPSKARLSPDGKLVAVLMQTRAGVPQPGDPEVRPSLKLYVRGLDDKQPRTDLGVECQAFAWSADGTEIVCSDFTDGPNKKSPEATHFVVNVKTKKKTTLKLPEDHLISDWSSDGRYFLTTSMRLGKDQPAVRLHRWTRDGSEEKVLTDPKQGAAVMGRFSPDGTRVLFQVMVRDPKADSTAFTRTVSVLDVPSGKATPVADTPLNGEIMGYCWSPDGKRIAYTWREIHSGKPEDNQGKETESHLVVCDPSGKNAKTIASEKGRNPWAITLADVDWR
jgi:Tol biopolymer transport system component